MKIIYIANARIPTEKAHGIQIMKMCEAFANAGNEVELVVPRRLNYIKENPFEYYGVKENFKIIKLPTLDLIIFGKVGFWIQSLNFAKFATIYTLFKKSDIIYSRDELPLFLLSFFKKNIIWEVHMPRDNFISRILIKRIQKIVTISQGLKDFYIKKFKINPNKILVAHDGVDLKNFPIEIDREKERERLALTKEKPIIMYIGRLDPWKGVETLLEASKILNNIQVVIIGEGSELEKFKQKYQQVVFKGFLPYRDLAYNQSVADILVIPNSGKSKVSSFYTSPLKVFAHMASNIPIIASDLSVLREVLNENNSVLVEPDNSESLASGILKILENKNLAEEISKQAFEDVKNYTWNKRVKNILEFIK